MIKLTHLILEDESIPYNIYTKQFKKTFKYQISLAVNMRRFDEGQVKQFVDEISAAFHNIQIEDHIKKIGFLLFFKYGPFGSEEAAMPTMYGIEEIAKRHGTERGIKINIERVSNEDNENPFSTGNENARYIEDYVNDPPVNEDSQISQQDFKSDFTIPNWKVVIKYSKRALDKIQPYLERVHQKFGEYITSEKEKENGFGYIIIGNLHDLKQVRQIFFDLRMSAVKYNDWDSHIKVYLVNSSVNKSQELDPSISGPDSGFNLNESQKKTIVLLSCVLTKLSHPAPAKELYDSPLFHKSLAYAMSLHPDAIYILSAKHFLLPLDKVIAPYNKTLLDMPADDVREWAAHTLSMLAKVSDFDNDQFIILAGDKYRKYIEPELAHSTAPLEGLRIGEQLQWYTKHLTKKDGEAEKV
jgi:hypothetical protein